MKHNDLTQGNILKGLTKLAFPIMGTSFLQMAYNIVDMIWIGKLGSSAVAAVGTAGFLMWFSFSLIVLSQVGAEVNISQSLGAKNPKRANEFATTALVATLIIGIIYGIFLIIMRHQLIGFFNLGDVKVEGMAINYLYIVAFSMPFAFLNPIVSGIYNGSGNSKIPFRVNSLGLVLNLILDPLFIFVLKLGVKGAAYATLLAQVIVTIVFIILLLSETKPFAGFHIWTKASLKTFKQIVKISYPVAMQNGLFAIFAMFIAKIVATHGTTAIAVQKVGTQIEAISYMTAQGFGSALSAFTGQNLGAKEIHRVKKGFKLAGIIMGGVGILTSLILFFGAEYIFKIFINEEPALSMGIVYLRIIGISQLFMCLEITMAGGFNGLGKSMPPAIISIGFNGLRIPIAYAISTYTLWGLNGIWWTISITSILKGSILLIVIFAVLKNMTSSESDIKEKICA